jgi:hypothetical protein
MKNASLLGAAKSAIFEPLLSLVIMGFFWQDIFL